MPSGSTFARELDVAVAAARAAGRIQVERYERLERIVHKGERDVVTEADHLSEEAIIAAIREAFPEDAFLAEESGHSGPGVKAGTAADAAASVGVAPEASALVPAARVPAAPVPRAPDRLWVIDPLDGTVNYANGIPFFAVSVALAVRGVPSVGVVLDPVRDELFSAVLGGGAWLDGQPIEPPVKERLKDAVVSLALPARSWARRELRVRRAVRVPRSMGSATLALAYVANGRFDAFIQVRGLSSWDIAAAGLIVAEAGARVTSFDGGPWFDIGRESRSIGIVAAAPAHHGTLLELLA